MHTDILLDICVQNIYMNSCPNYISNNKSLLTNVFSLCLLSAGSVEMYPGSDIVFNIGLFAFSGAVTNWIAVHMLFEKVPFLYGSGIVPARFEEFKKGIHSLIMTQFFTPENVERFFHEASGSKDFGKIDFSFVVDKVDFSPVFDSVSEAVLESSMGGMLNMFGGKSLIDGLKDPCVIKIKEGIVDIVSTDSFKEIVSQELMLTTESTETIEHVDKIVQSRLEEMTPKMVKDIVQDMIKRHLGWLVVWGGVFGGLIGFFASFVR